MTEPSATASPSPDATPPLMADLIAVLAREAELRTQQLRDLDGLIRARTHAVRSDIEEQLGAETQRTKRAKWYSIVFGLLAVIIGAILFYLVLRMTYDMNRMEDYMYNMGHSLNDDRPIESDERKHKGTSYINSMAGDMQAMRLAMSHMEANITAMATDMKAMSGDMNGMRIDMGGMSRDMTTMNLTMDLLRQDTALLRIGVGGMSNDTRAMGVPFRVMRTRTQR